ncbi:hypothetical protein [Cellulomonas sp. URHD0024]|uniref:hypothetical protein n=1 Tax=Cellulomonas sp. URHD0024 TaxID=1302620 RepID=UPI000429A52E|nr:hypothetical protein [Cellulomonas sp. URHD0024]
MTQPGPTTVKTDRPAADPTKVSKVLSITATIALGLTLTACSPAHTTLNPQSTQPAAEAPAPAPTAGQFLTTVAESDAAKAAGLQVFPMSTDGLIAFDPTQPLPEVIKADIAAPVIEVLRTSPGSTSLYSSAHEAAASATETTGRKVIVVFAHEGMIDPDAEETTMLYSAYSFDQNTELGAASVSASLDQTLATTQAWVTAQPDASAYEIVVAVG